MSGISSINLDGTNQQHLSTSGTLASWQSTTVAPTSTTTVSPAATTQPGVPNTGSGGGASSVTLLLAPFTLILIIAALTIAKKVTAKN
jgi:hypothetical protein